MTKKFLVVLGWMMLSWTSAASDLYTGRYATCMDQSGGITFNMLDCISEELHRQDAWLNSTYRELRDQLSPERRQALLTAQRLWIQYRDANCGFYADPEGGTRATLLARDCVLRETAERADELRILMMMLTH